MRFRLKSFLIAAAIIVPVLAAAYMVPRRLDVEGYKPALVEAVKQATGRDLVIDGPLRLTLWPVPRVSARSVHFANAVGGTGAQMVEVRWIGASPSWSALLQGRVEIGRLILYKPVVVLETDADGVPNWEFKPGAGSQQEAGAASEGLHLAVGKLDIVDGTLTYTNPATGKTVKAEQVKATASVGSLAGPFSIDGTATVNGVPLSLEVSVKAPGDDGVSDARLAVKVPSGHLSFDGRTSAIARDATVSGRLEVTTGALTDFISALVRAIGEPLPAFDTSVAGSFAFSGGIEISPTRLAVNDFKASLGSDSAAGTLALTHGPQPSLQGRLSLRQVDLDKWLELLAQPGAFLPKTSPVPPAAARPATAPAKPAAPAKPVPPAAGLSPFPLQLGVDLDLDVAETVFRKDTIRDLALELQVRDGTITVPRLEATLPGGMLVQADAAVDAAGKGTGTFTLAGSRLRETLAWLGVDASGVPQAKLQSLSLKGKVTSTAGSLNVADGVLLLDGQSSRAGGTLTFGPPFTVSATLDADRFDLDAYMPGSDVPAETAVTDAGSAVPPGKPGTPPAQTAAAPDKSTPKFQLKARIAKLLYRGEALGGVEANGTVQGNRLTVDGIKVADLLGAKIDLKGTVADFARKPRFDLTFNATVPDTEKLLAYATLPKFINGKIGPSSASGGLAGTFDGFSLRNATVTMLGATATVSGALRLGEAMSYDFPSFSLKAADAGRLIAVAAGRAPTSSVGAIAANGTLKGTDRQATFNGEFDALGARTQGSLAATLGARPNFTVRLRVPGTLNVDRVLGVSSDAPPAAPVAASGAAPFPVPRTGAATGKPIDLSGLRAFDATISLETSAISIASLRIPYADLEATLRNGVFTISRLTGQFYSGAVDFTGTIDASGQTLVVDLGGSLQGIYVGEMLRGTAGTNRFDNPNLSLSIDGKLSITGIQLRAQGKSPEEIRNNLTATAGLSGYVYPAVTQGSIDFVRFATSVGSIFSDDMAFISAMLRGFVNRQNPIQGQISIGGGAVTLQSPTVTGADTTATIAGNTSLTAATTDTVVSINTGNDQTRSDFLINVKGPLASPTVTTGRGPSR